LGPKILYTDYGVVVRSKFEAKRRTNIFPDCVPDGSGNRDPDDRGYEEEFRLREEGFEHFAIFRLLAARPVARTGNLLRIPVTIW
jgi:hypothetical protein